MNALLRLLGWTLAVALVALPVVAVLNGWVGQDRWPLTTLRATGQFDRVDEARLREAMLPFAQQGFFAVDLDAAQDAVARMPWVERAEVRKRWPAVREVRVDEHVPFARWGEDRLLSDHGRLFPAGDVDVPPGLPQLDGPDGRVPDVVEFYNQTSVLMAPLGLGVRSVLLDPRGSWSMELDSGAQVVVGRNEARPRIARFARLMPQLLAQQAQRLVRADLRYTNGFALSWAPVPKAPQTGMQGNT